MANMHLVTGYAGQEHITAADQAAFNCAVLDTEGQFVFDRGSKLSASIVTNNQIRVLDGDIFMQGRYIRLNEGSYVDLTIENGTQGYMRNDLIVARYTKDVSTGVEQCNLVVIKGENAASSPADPAYTAGDLIEDHDVLNDMPLYRVSLNGINVESVTQLFTLGMDNTVEIVVDDALSATSENPVQNKVVKAALDNKQNSSTAITTSNIGSQTVNKAKLATDDVAVGTAGLRNQYFSSTEETPTVNGQICWVYG